MIHRRRTPFGLRSLHHPGSLMDIGGRRFIVPAETARRDSVRESNDLPGTVRYELALSYIPNRRRLLSTTRTGVLGKETQRVESALIFQPSYVMKPSVVVPEPRRTGFSEAEYAIDFIDDVRYHIHDDVPLISIVIMDVG